MEAVTHVHVREDFHLELKYNTGETRIFDARPYLEKGAFRRLKDPALFRRRTWLSTRFAGRAIWTSRRKHSTTGLAWSTPPPQVAVKGNGGRGGHRQLVSQLGDCSLRAERFCLCLGAPRGGPGDPARAG